MLDFFILDFSEDFLFWMQCCCFLVFFRRRKMDMICPILLSLCVKCFPYSIYVLGTFWNNKNHTFLRFILNEAYSFKMNIFKAYYHSHALIWGFFSRTERCIKMLKVVESTLGSQNVKEMVLMLRVQLQGLNDSC